MAVMKKKMIRLQRTQLSRLQALEHLFHLNILLASNGTCRGKEKGEVASSMSTSMQHLHQRHKELFCQGTTRYQ